MANSSRREVQLVMEEALRGRVHDWKWERQGEKNTRVLKGAMEALDQMMAAHDLTDRRCGPPSPFPRRRSDPLSGRSAGCPAGRDFSVDMRLSARHNNAFNLRNFFTASQKLATNICARPQRNRLERSHISLCWACSTAG